MTAAVGGAAKVATPARGGSRKAGIADTIPVVLCFAIAAAQFSIAVFAVKASTAAAAGTCARRVHDSSAVAGIKVRVLTAVTLEAKVGDAGTGSNLFSGVSVRINAHRAGAVAVHSVGELTPATSKAGFACATRGACEGGVAVTGQRIGDHPRGTVGRVVPR